mgnify:CR=1 FL=1
MLMLPFMKRQDSKLSFSRKNGFTGCNQTVWNSEILSRAWPDTECRGRYEGCWALCAAVVCTDVQNVGMKIDGAPGVMRRLGIQAF